MRILHVTPGVSPGGGGHLSVTGLVRALVAYGVDATVLTTDAAGSGRLQVALNERVMRDGAAYVFHPVWRFGGRYGLAPSLLRTLRRMVRSADLVHIHWLFNFSCVAAARVALGAGVPFVIQPHGSLDPHLGKRNELLKRAYLATVGRPLLRHAAAVVFTAEAERAEAVYHPRRPDWVIPAGIDRPGFERLPPRGTFRAAFPEVDGPFVLFLGRVSPQKGLDLLLPAFKRLARRRPEIRLVVAGPDYRGHAREVRALAERLELGTRVTFTGIVSHEVKLAAFVDAEFFVLPSYAENFGVVIMEALACGLPVVISDQVKIHQELLAAGVARVVECNVDSLAAGLEAQLADEDGRRQLALNGPAFVRARYTWDAIVPGLVRKYAEIIA